MGSLRLSGVAVALVILASCGEQLAPPASDSADGGADGNGNGDDGDSGPTVQTDASSDAPSEARGPSTGERIPTVPAGVVRITPTEITQRQYKAFLDEVAGTNVPQPAECSWNTSFAPATGGDCVLDANATPNRPVRCVDWCDAFAYCEWAGLRLCGKIGGGANPLAAYKDPGSSQWFAACGGSANTPYPYGGSLDHSACSFSLGQSGPPTDVGTMAGCEGGYPDVFDMLGNMGEWEDSCGAQTGASDQCRIRGGYYTYAADQINCGTAETYPRDQKSPKFGIRCCSK